MNIFDTAEEAFEFYYDDISRNGIDFCGGLTIFNAGFTILDPMNNHIKTDFRKWSAKYAEREWNWYLTGDPGGNEISKHAPIWLNHMDDDGNVRSNYGHQWQRNDQIGYVVDELKRDPQSRRAGLTFYDGKEHDTYAKDTPCTIGAFFTILNGKLNMTISMRSNDLWFGFCNDQYCFSMLQKLVADRLDLEVGEYHHFNINFHIYHNFLNKN